MSAWKMWQIICWIAGIWQRWGIQLTPFAYTRSSKQTLCLGFEGKRVFGKREKKGSRAYDELLQIKWPKEVKPLLYFLIELIQNPIFFFTWLKFSHQFFSKAAVIALLYMYQVSLSLIFCSDLQIWLSPITGTRVLLEISTHVERQ